MKKALYSTFGLFTFGLLFVVFVSFLTVFANVEEFGGGYATQSLVEVDDHKKSYAGYGDHVKQSSAFWNWIGSSPTVWRDLRTGLYWTENVTPSSSDRVSNSFSIGSCPFFNLNRGNYTGSDASCGDAINLCAQLNNESFGGRTGWYLPSADELLQAYVNGIYVNTTDTFVTTHSFWSATERANSTNYAWSLNLYNGSGDYYAKGNDMYVRCVSRD